MPEAKIAAPGRSLSALLCYAAAALMPSIRLLDLYNRNRVENNLIFWQVLMLAGMLAIAGVLLFLVSRYVVGSAEGALLIAVLCWLCFWLSVPLFNTHILSRGFFFGIRFRWLALLMVAGLVLVSAVFRRCKPPFAKIRPAFSTLAAGLVVMFVFNLYTCIGHSISLARARASVATMEGGARPFYIKQCFRIDPALPSPNILWLHLDGMMSLGTAERFWGESQEHLRHEFASRGFLIYEDALLNAENTRAALAALFSPAFYDSFLGAHMAEAMRELHSSRQAPGALATVGLRFIDVSESYELFGSLTASGYEIIVPNVGNWGGILPIIVSHSIPRWLHSFVTGDLLQILWFNTPLALLLVRIVEGFGEADLSSYLSYSLGPRFVLDFLDYTHISQVSRMDPSLTAVDFTAVHLYPLAFEHMAQRTLYIVDAVLEENPNVVIVLQADHGFHVYQTQRHLIDQGYSLSQVLELMHSVFSAVRIPPQYGGLDAPIAPLNISRELVNRFVGENYVLLPGAGEIIIGDDDGFGAN